MPWGLLGSHLLDTCCNNWLMTMSVLILLVACRPKAYLLKFNDPAHMCAWAPWKLLPRMHACHACSQSTTCSVQQFVPILKLMLNLIGAPDMAFPRCIEFTRRNTTAASSVDKGAAQIHWEVGVMGTSNDCTTRWAQLARINLLTLLECDRVTDALLVCNWVILQQGLGNHEMNASKCSHCNSCIVLIYLSCMQNKIPSKLETKHAQSNSGGLTRHWAYSSAKYMFAMPYQLRAELNMSCQAICNLSLQLMIVAPSSAWRDATCCKLAKAVTMAGCSRFHSTAKFMCMSSQPGRLWLLGQSPLSRSATFSSSGRLAYSGWKTCFCRYSHAFCCQQESFLQGYLLL